jgi:hypothetical protein
MEVNETLLASLIETASSFKGYGEYDGLSWRKLIEEGSYEEEGLTLVPDDIELTQLYAGLAVLSSDLTSYLSQSPRKDAAWFEEVIASVHSKEQKRYGTGAFPYVPYDDSTNPHKKELEAFPWGLAQAADQGHPTVTPLGNIAIRHEWTVKPGKKLLIEFGAQFHDIICEKNGLYERFRSGLLSQANLPITVATAILTGISAISAVTLWYPLAVYIALLIIEAGLGVYCKPQSPQPPAQQEARPTG